MTAVERILLVFLSAAPLLASAQSQRQIADRHVKQSTVTTMDERKGERGLRTIKTCYDRKGNPTEVIEQDANGRILRKENHVYDRRGRESASSETDSSGSELRRVEITRDRWGNETASCTWSHGAITERTETRYDANGDKVEEVAMDSLGRRTKRTTYVYDAKGLIQRRTIRDANDKVIYERTFDYTY